MSNYIEQAEGKTFLELSNDDDFKKDLVRFFSGGRYRLSKEEIKERGFEGLANDFVEHMRYQSTNEATALKDLQFVQDKKNVDPRALESFGNLMNAYDRSEGGGTGFVEGAVDYIGAVATSPSTAITIGTGGWGIGSKLFGRAAGKATQMTIRKTIDEMVKKGMSKKAINEAVKKSVVAEGLKGAGRSAAFEGAIGAGMGYATGETREEVIEDYEYGTKDIVADAVIGATIGGAVGGGAAAFGAREKNKAIEVLTTMSKKEETARKKARTAANKTIKENLRTAAGKEARERSLAVAETLMSREKDKLPVDLVKEGDLIKKELVTGSDDRMITNTLSLDTLRGITAATIELRKEVKPRKNERITSAVSRFIREAGDEPKKLKDRVKKINKIRDTYGLSSEELSYVYLSDLSQAGKTLNEASQIQRALQREQLDTVMTDLESLARAGVTSYQDNVAQDIISDAINNKGGVPGTLLNMAKEADAARIAFMTSQVGTTAANATTSAFNTVLDITDNFWKAFLPGQPVQKGWMGSVFANVRGMTISKNEAIVLREMMLKDQPLAYQNLFHDVQRAEVVSNSNSGLAKLSRFVNTLNTGVDGIFKQSMLYAGVDRRLRQQGTTFGEFIQSAKNLDDLPPGLLQDAMEDANRFTFQQTYVGDKSKFGAGVRTVVKAHREMPFLVSGGLGIPFPRYIANHLEYINDYTPIGLATGGLTELESKLYKGTNYKTWQDRTARQISGAAMLMGGTYLAAQKQGELDYGELKTKTGGSIETGRVAGPFAAHLLLGDLLYRWYNGMPIGNMGEDALEVALGMGDLGFDLSVAKNAADSISAGEFTEPFEKQLGNILSTFTYPATIARDMKGQISIESAPTPYTRPITPDSEEEEKPSMFGERNFLADIMKSELMFNQAVRFLPDLDFTQYTQSFNGRTDVPLYDGFNQRPVGMINPITKQMGFQENPELNGLEKELNVLKLEKYQLFNSRSVPNPAVHWAVSFRMSKTMAAKFDVWRKEVKLGNAIGDKVYGDRTYDELGDDYRLREKAVREFVRQEVADNKKFVESKFNDLMDRSPRQAVGYIRNLYPLLEKQLQSSTNVKDIYDRAVQVMDLEKPDGTKYKDAGEYLGDADTIGEEIKRRKSIMNNAKMLDEGSNKVVPETR